ncbi:MAG: hypothetical protein JNK45_17370, partial [Myxococcales bacterium]|nr:hypothetical protein [Myxococcales bacterium]
MKTTQTKEAALARLLQTMFPFEGLRMFLSLNYPEIGSAIAGEKDHAVAAGEAALRLASRGEVTEVFWSRLENESPGRSSDIQAVRTRWEQHPEEPPPRTLQRQAIHRDPIGSSKLLGATSLGFKVLAGALLGVALGLTAYYYFRCDCDEVVEDLQSRCPPVDPGYLQQFRVRAAVDSSGRLVLRDDTDVPRDLRESLGSTCEACTRMHCDVEFTCPVTASAYVATKLHIDDSTALRSYQVMVNLDGSLGPVGTDVPDALRTALAGLVLPDAPLSPTLISLDFPEPVATCEDVGEELKRRITLGPGSQVGKAKLRVETDGTVHVVQAPDGASPTALALLAPGVEHPASEACDVEVELDVEGQGKCGGKLAAELRGRETTCDAGQEAIAVEVEVRRDRSVVIHGMAKGMSDATRRMITAPASEEWARSDAPCRATLVWDCRRPPPPPPRTCAEIPAAERGKGHGACSGATKNELDDRANELATPSNPITRDYAVTVLSNGT